MAYERSPSGMRSVVVAMFFFTTGIGNYVGALILQVVAIATSSPICKCPWIPGIYFFSKMKLLLTTIDQKYVENMQKKN